MELWARFLVASLAVTVTLQRSVREIELSAEDSEEHGFRANSDMFSDEQTESESNCSCDWRYMRHYEAKGCSIVQRDSCDCPTKFDCPNLNEIEEDNQVCNYKGVKYPPGAKISVLNPCEMCRCSRGPVVEIVCYPVECPEFQNRLPANCHYVYKKNQCCPVESVCIEDEEGVLLAPSTNTSTRCEHNGRIYPLGALMYSDDDPCEVCLCSENWEGKSDPRCYQVNCNFEKQRSKLTQGCVPIYQENVCCPVDYYCATDDEFLSGVNDEGTENSEYPVLTDSGCAFGGKFYNVGDSAVPVKQLDKCVSCTCRVPPDMTCVVQSCSPNPNDRFCVPFYTPGSCCPNYDCMYGDEPVSSNHTFSRLTERVNRELEDDGSEGVSSDSEGTCFETQCSGDMTCLLYQVSCGNTTCSPVPTCLKTNSSCETAKCASGCVVIEQDENKCLTCACGEDIQKHAGNLKCQMPQCNGQNCHLIGGADGCPTCSCEAGCEELHCKPGCNVISEREGACPKCVCEDETEGCPTPVCEHEGCQIVNLTNGCPTCVCDRGRSILSGRELEDNVSPQQPKINLQQQQQQQQQQASDIDKDEPENLSPEDYGDDIMVMSGSSASQAGSKANVRARSLFENAGERTFGGDGGNAEQLDSVWHIMDDDETYMPSSWVDGRRSDYKEGFVPEFEGKLSDPIFEP